MPPISWTQESPSSNERLDSALAARVEGLSRAAAQRIIRDGGVCVDGRTVTRPSYSLSNGQAIEVHIPAAPEPGVAPVSGNDVAIVYHDDHIAVVDKAAGVTVHPGSGHLDDTLVNYMLARFPSMATVGEADRPGVVHRLDRDTSGLLLFALSQRAYSALVDALKKRLVNRTYVALVHRRPDPAEGVIDAPIGRDPRNRTRQAVVSDGKSARTKYKTVRRLGPWSLLEVQLETGRMHQVRVHLAAAGYPVGGDPTYGHAPRLDQLSRQFLHASKLALDHPITDERLNFESPLPADLQAVMDELDRTN